MKLKRKVVMLPSNEKANDSSCMALDTQLNKLLSAKEYLVTHFNSNDRFKTQHLYFLSDEEIKVSDWSLYEFVKLHKVDIPMNGDHKIIATTDKSLELPEPSPEFIDKFIREYNKGNVIEEVMVEYEEDGYIIHQNFPKSISPRFYLKVDKNNYITIIKVKDSWSREEVEELVGKARDFGKRHGEILWNKWVEENL